MDELSEYLAASAAARQEMRVRRKIGQGPVTVRLCVGRRNGKTELLRRTEELMEPGSEDEALQRLRELMEQAITERVQGVEWASELTPTTLRKTMQEMRKVKVPPLDPDPVRYRWLRMMLAPAGAINHNAVVTVTELMGRYGVTNEEDVYESSENAGCCDGGWGDDRVRGECAWVCDPDGGDGAAGGGNGACDRADAGAH